MSSVHRVSDTRILHRECATLVRHGWEVTLIANGEQNRMEHGVRILVLPAAASRTARATRNAWRALCMGLRERADVYHLHDPELIWVAVLLRMLGKRVVYDAHEHLPNDVRDKPWAPAFTQAFLVLLARCFVWAAGTVCHGIVAATPDIATHFPARKTAIVLNLPDHREFAAAALIPWCSRQSVAAYIGGVWESRGARVMVNAMARVTSQPAPKLVMAGSVHPAGYEQVLRGLPGWDRCEFVGYLDRAGVAALLGRTRVGLVVLQPTDAFVRSLPIKLFEYLAAGVPVVASDFPMWRELVAGYECVRFVDPTDPGAVAGAVDEILSDAARGVQMSLEAKAIAQSRFTWASQEEVLLTLYQQVAGSGGGN